MTAAENIQARAGRWWHHFVGKDSSDDTGSDPVRTSRGAIVPLSWIPTNHNPPPKEHPIPSIPTDHLNALLEAARRRRQGNGTLNDQDDTTLEDEYWSPMKPNSTSVPYDEQPAITRPRRARAIRIEGSGITEVHQMDQVLSGWVKSLLSTAPVAVSLLGAVFAGMTNGLGAANSSEVAASTAAGPLPAEVTSGLFMHMFLAAAVWYMIGAVVSGVATFLAVSVVMMRRENKD